MENLNSVYTSNMSLVESKSDKKRAGVLCTLRGPFMVAEDENNNGRWYPKSLIDKCILGDDTMKKLMEAHCLYGEASHPEERFDTELPLVSHAVTNLEWGKDGKTLIGEVDILDTPSGRIMATLCKYGAKMGVSVRARGNLIEKNGKQIPDEDSYIAKTFDLVPNPGFEQARLSIVNESCEDNINGKMMLKDILSYINSADKKELSIIQPIFESVSGEFAEAKNLVSERLGDTLSRADKADTKTTDTDLGAMVSESCYEALYDENVELLEQVENLENAVASKDTLIESLRKEVEKLKTSLSESADLTKITSSADLNKYQLAYLENSKIKKKIESMKAKLSEKNERYYELETSYNELNESYDELSTSFDHMTGYFNSLSESYDGMVKKYKQVINEREGLYNYAGNSNSKNSFYLNESLTERKVSIGDVYKPNNRMNNFIRECMK